MPSKAPQQSFTFYSLKGLGDFLVGGCGFLNERMMAFRASTASSHGQGASASSQVDLQGVGFYLANQYEVQDPEFVRNENIGLIVSVLGMHSRPLQYPPGRSRCISA